MFVGLALCVRVRRRFCSETTFRKRPRCYRFQPDSGRLEANPARVFYPPASGRRRCQWTDSQKPVQLQEPSRSVDPRCCCCCSTCYCCCCCLVLWLGFNMANRKRPLAGDCGAEDESRTPKRRGSQAAAEQDGDPMCWGLDETCRFLRAEGLHHFQDIFTGWWPSCQSAQYPATFLGNPTRGNPTDCYAIPIQAS